MWSSPSITLRSILTRNGSTCSGPIYGLKSMIQSLSKDYYQLFETINVQIVHIGEEYLINKTTYLQKYFLKTLNFVKKNN